MKPIKDAIAQVPDVPGCVRFEPLEDGSKFEFARPTNSRVPFHSRPFTSAMAVPHASIESN